ncbi:MAG: glycine zipper 2TM domain-containing protein [Steroidobacteraceae bacterium]
MLRRLSLRQSLTVALLALPLAAWAAPPPEEPEDEPDEVAGDVADVPDVTLYAYPEKGQTPAQLDRDRYECYRWAMKQTGFDPAAADVPPHRRVRVVAGPAPGEKVVAGAVTGAVLGAAVSNPYHAGNGALIGAVAGTVVGAVAASSDEAERRRIDEAERRREQDRAAAVERKAESYRRALGACLEGRGYRVR